MYFEKDSVWEPAEACLATNSLACVLFRFFAVVGSEVPMVIPTFLEGYETIGNIINP